MKFIYKFRLGDCESTMDDESSNHVAVFYKCSICNERFWSIKEKVLHVRTLHKRKRRGRSHGINRKAVVVLKRLNFFEIDVTTPKHGYRTISYIGLSFNRKNGCEKYEHYRTCTIPALPSHKRVRRRRNNPSSKSLNLKIPENHPYVFSLHNYSDDMHSILSIITGSLMSTRILDAYLSHLLDKYYASIQPIHNTRYSMRNRELLTNIKYRILSVMYLPFHATDPMQRYYCDYDRFPKSYPLDEDTVLFCPMYCCSHFYLAVLHFSTRSCHIIDSSWHYLELELRIVQCKRLIQNLAGFSGNEWNIYQELKCCQQFDEFSCGVYVIYYVENILRGNSYLNNRKLKKIDIQKIRTAIVTVLLGSTQKGQLLMEAISE